MAELDKADAVFEGGGVKGIGLVGALEHLEERGVKLQNVVGTSAGAIVAALVAAGYSAGELSTIMEELDYRRFTDMSALDRVPLLGPALSVLREKGLYEGAYFERWLRDLLARAPRKVRTFRDLHMQGEQPGSKYFYKLQVIAADLTRRKQLVLPWDIRDYGMEPEELDVARAVRMSMSIPFFFEPVRLQDGGGLTCYIVDGGVLSNFPVDILDDKSLEPPWPTFGLKLVDQVNDLGVAEEAPSRIQGPVSLLRALFSTMMEAHDRRYIQEKNFDRTIPIPTLGVKTTDFGIRRERSQALRVSGQKAAERFFQKWNFQEWIQKHRVPEVMARRDAEATGPAAPRGPEPMHSAM
ncbi:patatin-like phospholipase family protein [Archangium violaceum]|uniref:patatin-like phospholipase family protein n=1 Tax=Archangium violaceum TaxID=83451 RepID=UPI00193B6566|nr:patatin-like phospholipase family protein [Archangium violaceum]QRK08168.1 patatin-like phospholipase family protein [Archangium violaceum]